MSAELKFWGVRGSIPTPGARTAGFGGNTPCVEVRGGHAGPLILDAGTGIRELGLALLREYHTTGASVNVLLTHFHWDHIQGLPFFAPLYESEWEITFYSPLPAGETRRILEWQLSSPCFPASAAVRARCRYRKVEPAGTDLNGLAAYPVALRHPDGSTGYRIETSGTRIVYATDHEFGDPSVDDTLVRSALGADVLVCDAQFTPEELTGKKGWGHSTWLQATQLARAASAQQLVLFHHDPERDDEAVQRIESHAQAEFRNTVASREGLSIHV